MARRGSPKPRRNNPRDGSLAPPPRMGKVPALGGLFAGLARVAEAFGAPASIVAGCDAAATGAQRLTDRAHEIREHVDAVAEVTTPIIADAVNAVRGAHRAQKDEP